MFSKLKPAIGVCAALILAGVICVKTKVTSAAPQGDTVTVKMTADHKFEPESVTIKAGQSVEWSNDEPGGLHQVTTDADLATDPSDVSSPKDAKPFDSKLIKSGKTFKYTFTTPGVYKYVCPPHEDSGMKGVVTVK